jgi:hypothetical protein
MNTQQLGYGDPIFADIKDCFAKGNYQLGMSIIQATPPPQEWIIELPSKSRQGESYKTIPIDIMEAAMKIIFGSAGISKIKDPIIVQDRQSRFAATVIVEYFYNHPAQSNYPVILPGIATVSSPDICMLELATPKASSMAVKNAIKQLGDLFGKSLNKSEEETEIPLEPEERKVSHEEYINSIADQVLTCKTIEDLKSYRLLVYNKKTPTHIQELYEQRLRTLKKIL